MSREKMMKTLRSMKHRPRVRGGNGTPIPRPQQALVDALGPDWTVEFVVATGPNRSPGFPPHYKIDIANKGAMAAIEVDGKSHCLLARKQMDRKKEKFLASRGWTVLRFSNEAAMERLEECVQTVLSTTSRLKSITTTLPVDSWSTTATTA